MVEVGLGSMPTGDVGVSVVGLGSLGPCSNMAIFSISADTSGLCSTLKDVNALSNSMRSLRDNIVVMFMLFSIASDLGAVKRVPNEMLKIVWGIGLQLQQGRYPPPTPWSKGIFSPLRRLVW